MIGKLKIKAKNVRLKMCPEALKNFIRKWIRRWRESRTLKMRRQVLGLMAERSQKSTPLVKTAQQIYSYVVKIQRTFRRFLHRKRFLMIIYSMSWIVAEKRYLAKIKLKSSSDKDKIKTMDIRELMRM